MLRKRQVYIDKYGPVVGPKLYHALQSQAAHAGVSARLRRKLEAIRTGENPQPHKRKPEPLPLFPDLDDEDRPEHAGSNTALTV